MSLYANYLTLAKWPVSNRDIRHYSALEFGEAHLHQARIRIMIKYFAFVVDHFSPLSAEEKDWIDNIIYGLCRKHSDAAIYLDKFAEKPLHHDVKADAEIVRKIVESHPTLCKHVEKVHWAATSEDMSNIAWAQLHRNAVQQHVIPKTHKLLERFAEIAETEIEVAALALTHGQAATPTTYGKRFGVFIVQISNALIRVKTAERSLRVKCNGPTGSNNAAILVWRDYATKINTWIESMNFIPEIATHQCSNYDSIITLLDALAALALAVANCADNIHRYIEADEMRQGARGEFASSSSVMPHKINPHALESAGAHLRKLVHITTWMKLELGQNRWERELHTHPPERSYGDTYALLLTGIANVSGTIADIRTNRDQIRAKLDAHPEVFSEAFNTIARAADQPGEYAAMAAAMHRAADKPIQIRTILAQRSIDQYPVLHDVVTGKTPYIGDAVDITHQAIAQIPKMDWSAIFTASLNPKPTPVLIMNVNQLLLNTEKFLNNYLANLTNRDPEFEPPNFPSSQDIHNIMRMRIPLHAAFETWFPHDHASRLAQYLKTCAQYASEAMPDGPEVLEKLQRTHQIIICSDSGTTSIGRRLTESGYKLDPERVQITNRITSEMVKGHQVTVITCNPIRNTVIPAMDSYLLDKIVVTGLYTRVECRDNYSDSKIATSLYELLQMLE